MHVIIPTVAMLAVLTASSMANFSVAVMAPAAAADIGVKATDIGMFTAIIYVVAMFTGMATGTFVGRFGAIRVTQCTALCATLGMAVFTLSSPAAALGSAVLLGMAYGPYNPASGHVLARISPPSWRPLVFSIKQVGVPLGGALAGAAIPPLILLFGWRGAALATGLVTVCVALILQPLRKPLDTDRRPGSLWRGISIREPLLLVLKHSTLRRLAFAGFAYAGCQMCVGFFFVVYLTQSLDMSLVEAGAVFALVQGGGVAGRVVWGLIAGRWLSTRAMLGLLGMLIAACLVATATFTSQWPLGIIAAVGFVLGASSYGWVGIYLSEVASLAPEGRVSDATGGAQFIHFSGAAVIPPLFGALVTWSGSFAATFVVIAGAALAASVYVSWGRIS